jgi:hypothetical protein
VLPAVVREVLMCPQSGGCILNHVTTNKLNTITGGT